MASLIVPKPIEFEWDQQNSTKVRLRHGIAPREAEQPFFRKHTIVFDQTHSSRERRYQLLGSANDDRILFIVFTVRGRKVRIISARRASRKERVHYGKKIEENP